MRSIILAAGIVALCSCVSAGAPQGELTVAAYPPSPAGGISFLTTGTSRQIVIKEHDGSQKI
jgi:hypothetical protein